MKKIMVLSLYVVLVLSACSIPNQAPTETTPEAPPIQASVHQTPVADAPIVNPANKIADPPLVVRETPWRGGLLRAELYGTEEEYRGLLVTELRIIGPDRFVQTIPLDGEEPSQLFDDDYLFAIEDMNYDGEPDIRVAQGIFSGGNTPFDVFLWDAFTGAFVEDATLSALCSPKFMPYERLVTQSIADGAASHTFNVYANVEGQLIEFFRREYLFDTRDEKEYIAQSMLIENGWIELSREPFSYHNSMPYDAKERAEAIPPPSYDIVSTRYGVVGEKTMRVDACISQGGSAVNTIVVSGEDEVWQTITMEQPSPLRGDDQSDLSQSYFSLEDLNYDGYPDLRIVSDFPSNNEFYFFWLWNSEAERFVRCEALDPLNGIQRFTDGLLISYSKDNAATHYASLYAWVGGEPVCIYQLRRDSYGYPNVAYVMSLYDGKDLEPWAHGTEWTATSIGDYAPDEVVELDLSTATPVAEVAADERYNGPLNPLEHLQSLNSGAFTHAIDIYFQPVAIQRGEETDMLVHADSTGVYEHAPMTFKKLYETDPGVRIVGIEEGSKYRVYWLESAGKSWMLKTMSISGEDTAQTVMSGMVPSDVADMRLAQSNLDCFAIPVDGSDYDFALKLFNIWDTGNDDFGIGKPGDVLIMEGSSPLNTRYRFVEGRYVRIIKTDRGGALEIVPTEIPLHEGDVRNEKRLLILTGVMPKMAVLAHNGIFFQAGSNLYMYNFDSGEISLLSSEVAWFNGAFFTSGNASTVYAYHYANPDAGWDACVIPLLHIEGAEFTTATIIYRETTDLVAMGTKNGEPLAAAIQLSYLTEE